MSIPAVAEKPAAEATEKTAPTIPITIEFTYGASPTNFCVLLTIISGGLEMLFSNKRKHEILIPIDEKSGSNPTVQYLVQYLCDHCMKDPRKELFVLDDSVYVTQIMC